MFKFPDLQRETWREIAANPVVDKVRDFDSARDAYGDPQVLLPGQYDNQWHIFFHGFVQNAGQWFHHMVSDDGIIWKLKKKWQSEMGQSFIYKHKDEFLFYSSCYLSGSGKVVIKVFHTKDFEHFDDPITVIQPELEWELEGPYKQVRNPCMIKLPNNRYRLYYCGGVVFLDDLGYEEPKYISYAESDDPYGPFNKYGIPIISPNPSIFHRTLGSGAIKVFEYGDNYIGFYNGIHKDLEGRSTSSISMLLSEDGVNWIEAPYNPIISPDKGWKKAIVYQLDLVQWQDRMRIYFNARDEWRDGIEKIGMLEAPKTTIPIRKISGY